ncbi:MAG: GTPase [Deltaproteobacteria bacterium]|nr:GTPase [Deltaproteobacteria bacterium]MBW2445654.1 GTPase [Deltaproteobacteria bacterium]
MPPELRRRVVILGAAGRDFHDFNVLYREDPLVEVLAFTRTQIPGIEGRRYPTELAGPLYPDGIPILPESDLEAFCAREQVDEVVLAYSDLPHAEAMHLASRALASGADFSMPGPRRTMLASRLPVIAVSAVRTGCGKSQTARFVARRLAERGLRAAVLRHPMPYGDLARQRVQRFATGADLDAADCTAEEREEYEPYVEAGGVIFAGVDYAAILVEAEKEGQLVLWDGGNNDFPFLRPDLHIVLVDALRPDQVATHHPGEACLRMADLVVVNKVHAAGEADVDRVIEGVRALRPEVEIVRAASPVVLEDPGAVRGRRTVVVDDGPTLTHGGMAYGAGFVAASAAGAEILDPRPTAAPAIQRVYDAYPHLGRVLPAVGYGPEQRAALRDTIEASGAEVVVSGSPLDLAALLSLAIPVVRARYEYRDATSPGLADRIDAFLAERGLG